MASVVVSAVHRFCFLFPFHGIFYVSLFDCRFFLLLYFAFFYYVSFHDFLFNFFFDSNMGHSSFRLKSKRKLKILDTFHVETPEFRAVSSEVNCHDEIK